VFVQTGDEATSGPVTVELSAKAGKITDTVDLGFPITCSISRGRATCVTDGPIDPFEVIEFAVGVTVAPGGKAREMSLTAVAASPADGASDQSTETVPIVRTHD
jgi:hypothetical protein